MRLNVSAKEQNQGSRTKFFIIQCDSNSWKVRKYPNEYIRVDSLLKKIICKKTNNSILLLNDKYVNKMMNVERMG